jgi:hypothetical protein
MRVAGTTKARRTGARAPPFLVARLLSSQWRRCSGRGGHGVRRVPGIQGRRRRAGRWARGTSRARIELHARGPAPLGACGVRALSNLSRRRRRTAIARICLRGVSVPDDADRQVECFLCAATLLPARRVVVGGCATSER